MMAQPDNPKLYNALEQQARSKYPSSRTKGLTYAAAKWLSSEYAKNGGSYVDSIKEVDPKKRDYKKEELDKIKRKKSEKKRNIKKQGFVA
jgi:hypothetical protein